VPEEKQDWVHADHDPWKDEWVPVNHDPFEVIAAPVAGAARKVEEWMGTAKPQSVPGATLGVRG
jgi:hypothetical protein